MNLIINPKLNKQLSELSLNPPSAMLITGPKGAGKASLISHFASKIASLKDNSKIINISLLEDKKHILIDQIKDIKKIIKVKDSGFRIIVIADAELMTLDAQNSLLKVLEEPPKNVIFILSSSLPHLLLDTVRSRLIKINYASPNYQQLLDYAESMGQTEAQTSKYYQISQGRMGIFAALVKNDKTVEIINDIDDAKEILSQSPKERLARLDTVAKDYELSLRTIDAMILVSEAALQIAVQKGQYKAWLSRLEHLNKSYELLLKNVSAKLVFSKLFLVL